MRQVITTFVAITCLAIALDESRAQPLPGQPLPGQPQKAAIVGINNNSDFDVLVKGYTVVNGAQRTGLILQMKKNGGKAFETQVPPGIRYYTIYDQRQPDRILLNNFPVPIQNPNVALEIRPSLTNPGRLTIAIVGGAP